MIEDTNPGPWVVIRHTGVEEVDPNTHLRYDKWRAKRTADMYRQCGDPSAHAKQIEVAA